MSQLARGNFYDDVQDDHEYLDSSERDTDDENYEGAPNDNAHSHSSGFVHLSSLDDDALFNMLKKSVSYLFCIQVSSGIRSSKTISMMDAPAPSFRLLEEFDDNDNFIDDPRKRRAAGLPCDGNTIYDYPTCVPYHDEEHIVPNSEIPAPTHSTSHCKPAHNPSIADEPPGDGINADHHQDSPVFDRTPDANYDSSREAIPLAAVDIQGRLILLSPQESPATLKFKLLDSRISMLPAAQWPKKLTISTMLLAAKLPKSTEVINYDNVHVSYQQLATLRHSEKVYVDKFVINAFCRKMFKDKHPKDSRCHFFFSTVGDYLMNHEWNQTFLHDTCRRCFTLANGCFKFIASDYVSSTSLFFPILHDDHWFLFIVALHDGYFIFLDSFFREDELYQQNVRSTIIPNFVRA
ncbi:uncharacterized protein LOC120668974 isoform X3 [Panicum virgatum]|uniref:uncharacterized protein LOC120668974 isoform X3 n=1 Tax=Panicum virgatum TaxID=38727 RepID=UPI0019D642AF|nr:uncharacterized protein LOC120668974 isoform X3 [Panicum virgatum]